MSSWLHMISISLTHPGRAILFSFNIFADALSRRHANLGAMFLEWKQLEYFAGYDFRPKCELDPEMSASLTIRPTLIERIGSRNTLGRS